MRMLILFMEKPNFQTNFQAIKDMPNLCRDSQIKTLPKIADVLTQLLQVILW